MTRKDKFMAKAGRAADIILAGGGICCLVALTYFAYYDGWLEQRRFTSWIARVMYYVSPAVLATLFFTSLRLSAARKVNLAFFLVSAGVSVFTLEILLTVWSSLPSVMEFEKRRMRAKAAQALGVEFDSRTREQVVADLRGRQYDAVQSIFGQAFLKPQNRGSGKSPLSIDGTEVLPLGGVSNKLVVLCNEAGQYVSYKSDGHGFHNPKDVWNKAPVSIAVLGDSYAQGYCVPPDHTFVARIRERYPATLNLGIEGNGPLLMLASLKEYAASARPKVVLWFYFEGNDLPDLAAEAQNPILKNYLNQGIYKQGLMDRQPQIDRALLDYLETLRNKSLLLRRLEEIRQLIASFNLSTGHILKVAKLSQLRDRLGLVYTGGGEDTRKRASGTTTQDRDRVLMDLFSRILLTAKQEVASWGGKLYFIYLPAWEPYGDPDRAERRRERILKIVKLVGLPVIDIHQTFTQQPDPLDLFPFRLPAHYNEKGNRLVADQVLRAVSVDQ